MDNKPICLPVQWENIPIDLKKTPRWVLWRLVEVGDEGNKRWSKLPMQATGQAASSTNPATWTDFISVQDAYTSSPTRFDGIGFVFSEDDNLVGIDLDDVYDHQQGRFINAAMQQLADQVDGYMEVSHRVQVSRSSHAPRHSRPTQTTPSGLRRTLRVGTLP